MKTHFKLLIAATFILSCFITSSCQNKQANNNNNGRQMGDKFSNPDSAAQASIHVIQSIASNEKLRGALNLTADEAKQLTAGTAVPLQEISYSDLLKANPDSVTLPSNDATQNSLIYPLQINGTTKTTSVVAKTNDSWRVSRAGVNSYAEMLASQKPEGATNVSIVEVPGLSISFIKYSINDSTVYIASRTIPSVRIVKGEPMNERQTLQALALYAREIEKKYGKDISDKKVVD